MGQGCGVGCALLGTPSAAGQRLASAWDGSIASCLLIMCGFVLDLPQLRQVLYCPAMMLGTSPLPSGE